MADVFISYRRESSAMLAHFIARELEEHHGIAVYVDTRQSDSGGHFPTRLLQAIEDATVFVCLVAEGTFESDWVCREIAHAYKLNKVMIPVFQESYVPLDELPDSSIRALLDFDGVHVLDRRSIFVDQSVQQLAMMTQAVLGSDERSVVLSRRLLHGFGPVLAVLLIAVFGFALAWFAGVFEDDSGTDPTTAPEPTAIAQITVTATLAPTREPTRPPTTTPTVAPTDLPTLEPTADASPTLPATASYAALVPEFAGTVLEVTEAGDILNVRDAPSLDGAKIDELYWGDRMLWTGATTEAEEYTWYEVQRYNGDTAYVAYDPEWFVERDPGQVTPAIALDKTVRITASGNATHLCDVPNVTGCTVIEMLHTGDTLTVLDGPRYSEYYLWWKLQLPNGQTGWMVDVPGWWEVQ